MASKVQFAALIAMRNSKAYRILEWKGKTVFVRHMRIEKVHSNRAVTEEWAGAVILDCNHCFVTLEFNKSVTAFPLSRVEISYLHAKNQLTLEIYPIK